MRVDPTKKIILNEGRSVGTKSFQYGGFPRVIKETREEGATKKFEDNVVTDPKDTGAQNVATATDAQEETLWADKSLVHKGYRYPSKALMGLAKAAETGGYAARLELYKHPHWQEFQKGSPEYRSRPHISDRDTYGPGVHIDSSREGT